MKPIDYLFFILITLFVVSAVGFFFYLSHSTINACTSNPTKYYVDSIENAYEADFVLSTITVLKGHDRLVFTVDRDGNITKIIP